MWSILSCTVDCACWGMAEKIIPIASGSEFPVTRMELRHISAGTIRGGGADQINRPVHVEDSFKKSLVPGPT